MGYVHAMFKMFTVCKPDLPLCFLCVCVMDYNADFMESTLKFMNALLLLVLLLILLFLVLQLLLMIDYV